MKELIKKLLGHRILGLKRRLVWILRPTEREVKWLKKLVQINQLQGGTFIDIGAHLGMYSLTLSNIFSKLED